MTEITPEPTPGITRLPNPQPTKQKDKKPTPRGAKYKKPVGQYAFASNEVPSPATGTLNPDPNVPFISGSGWASQGNEYASETRPQPVNNASVDSFNQILFKDPVTGDVYRIANTYDDRTGTNVLQSIDLKDPDKVLEGSVYIGRRKNGQYFVSRKTDAANMFIDSLDESKFNNFRNELMRRGYRGIASSTDKNSNEFFSAVMDVLEIGNRANFDEFSSKLDSKGYVQFNKLDTSKLEFNPLKVAQLAPADKRFISDKARAITELKGIAYANGISYDDSTLESWATAAATNGTGTDDYAKRIRAAAAVAFPNFKDQLNAGANLTDIASAYIQTAADLLEMPRESFDLSKPGDVVRKALSHKNEKGAIDPMSLSDFETLVKQDPRWMDTKNASQTYTSLYENFSRMLGVGTHGAY